MLQVTDIDLTDWYVCTLSCYLLNICWFIIDLIDLYYCLLLFCIDTDWYLLRNMATAKVDEKLLERNVAYFEDTLLQIQCHNYNWEYEKIWHVVANMLVGDLRRILKCAVFLKENVLLPTRNEDKPEGQDSKSDDFSPSQADLDDNDIGLTFEKLGLTRFQWKT